VNFGNVLFFDVTDAPPRQGRPRRSRTFQEAIDAIVEAYEQRNKATFAWANGDTEVLEPPPSEADDDEA
jgi:hypothetical protein